MTLNRTAAAYGLFQVVFAELEDHLAIATFKLRERNDHGLTFEEVFKQPLRQKLRQFKCELRQFEGQSHACDSLYALREACKTISQLATWRNARIHARVRLTEDGYALYDWQTHRRLEISEEQIGQHINLALKVVVELAAHMQGLTHLLEFDKEFEKLFSTLPEVFEPVETMEADIL
jgi:hypothetical protein